MRYDISGIRGISHVGLVYLLDWMFAVIDVGVAWIVVLLSLGLILLISTLKQCVEKPVAQRCAYKNINIQPVEVRR